MRRTTPPRERRGGTCPPARPGGSYTKQMAEVLSHFGHLSLSSHQPPACAVCCWLKADSSQSLSFNFLDISSRILRSSVVRLSSPCSEILSSTTLS